MPDNCIDCMPVPMPTVEHESGGETLTHQGQNALDRNLQLRNSKLLENQLAHAQAVRLRVEPAGAGFRRVRNSSGRRCESVSEGRYSSKGDDCSRQKVETTLERRQLYLTITSANYSTDGSDRFFSDFFTDPTIFSPEQPH